eukprot:symbB.v1.2.039480.t1/scaffold6593.1/size16814/1
MDVVTYGTVIHAYGKGGLSQEALTLLKSMFRSNALQPSITTLNEALTACERGSQWQDAVYLGELLRMQGFQKDIFTYGGLASSYQRGSRWMSALQLLQRTSAVVCGSIITACAWMVQWQSGQAALVWQRQGSSASNLQICFRAMLMGFARSGHWEWTCAQLEEMWKKDRSNRTAAAPAFCIALNACEMAGKWREALLLLKLMDKRWIRRDEVSMASCASACTKRGLAWTMALVLMNEVLFAAIRLDVEVLTSALMAYEVGRKWRAAVKHLEVFQSFAVKMDETAILALTSCLAKPSS